MPSLRPLIRDGQIVTDDWQALDDEQSLPAAGDVIVSHIRWQQERPALLKHAGKIGVRIPNDLPVETLLDDLKYLDLIALEFPAFKDGRAYSQARLLRERYGFTRELRATGNVLRDQLFFMARCGINAFELDSGKDPQAALQGLQVFSVQYQPAADTFSA